MVGKSSASSAKFMKPYLIIVLGLALNFSPLASVQSQAAESATATPQV